MKEELRRKFVQLAEKYEVRTFTEEDPSQFLRWYSDVCDVETASFIAAMLSFGNRKQFIPKIRSILEMADGFANRSTENYLSGLASGKLADGEKKCGINHWILSEQFEKDFVSPDGDDSKKFYRFYSYEDMKMLFRAFVPVLKESGSLGEYIKRRFEKSQNALARGQTVAAKSQKTLAKDENVGEQSQNIAARCKTISAKTPAERITAIISEAFASCAIVPKGSSSANKRVHMFLRWMVRRNSPVDLGLWKWYSPADLIIPLDTHVVQEAAKLGLIKEGAGGTIKTALLITEQLKEVWPEDPCKGDFALFGLGVDDENRESKD